MASVDSLHGWKNAFQWSAHLCTGRLSTELCRLSSYREEHFQSCPQNGSKVKRRWESFPKVVTRDRWKSPLVHASRWSPWAVARSLAKREAFCAIRPEQVVGAAVTHQHVPPPNKQLVSFGRSKIPKELQSSRITAAHKALDFPAKMQQPAAIQIQAGLFFPTLADRSILARRRSNMRY